MSFFLFSFFLYILTSVEDIRRHILCALKYTPVTCTLSHTDKFIHQSVITSIHFSPCWLFFGTSYQLISSLFLILTPSKKESVRSIMYILKSHTVFNLLLTPISLTPNTFIFIPSHYHPFIYSSLLLIFLTNTPCAHYIQIILERGF